MEARQSESTRPPNSEDPIQQQLEQFAEEYRGRVADIAEDINLGNNMAETFEELYQSVAELSVQCMDLYIKLRYMEDMLKDE